LAGRGLLYRRLFQKNLAEGSNLETDSRHSDLYRTAVNLIGASIMEFITNMSAWVGLAGALTFLRGDIIKNRYCSH